MYYIAEVKRNITQLYLNLYTSLTHMIVSLFSFLFASLLIYKILRFIL